MPNWNDVLAELGGHNRGAHDQVRLKYLARLRKHTGRNVLVYYSGWLQKPNVQDPALFTIHDSDKTGFMTCSSGVDRSKGLDLILHTPGGDVAATESIVDYLHSLYNGDIRAIIPQLAMSGGTLIALSCKQILMGRQSSLGPIDPQIGGMPAQGIIEEFERAAADIKADPSRIPMWQPIIGKYWPTLITSCQHAIDWSDQLLEGFLTSGMFSGCPEAERKAKIGKIAEMLGRQATSKSHNRHISKEKAKALGLSIVDLEQDQKLQDLVLTLHHALTLTFVHTGAVKLIENDKGVAYIQQVHASPR